MSLPYDRVRHLHQTERSSLYPPGDRSHPLHAIIRTDMAPLVTVTGATGNNGRAIAEALLRRGVRVRAVGRSGAGLAPLAEQGADVRVGDLSDTAFLTEAFRGVDAAFAMIPQRFDVPDYRAHQERLVTSVTDALEAAGVPRVVALSTPASRLRLGPPVALAEFEERLRAMPGRAVAVLHPMFFMENHLSAIPMIRNAGFNGGAIRGDLPLPMIATRDIAAVAVEYLLEPASESYIARPLLGPRDYTLREASALLGAGIGRPDLPYVELPYDGLRQGLLGAGFSETGAEAMVALARAYNEGLVTSGVNRDATTSTPTTLEAFVHEVFGPAYRHADTGTHG
jgi:uncharacterized protein YbjT (DUF2867 family)